MPPKPEDLIEDNLADDVRAAFADTSNEDGASVVEDAGRPRDEAGKFVAKPGESEAEAAARLQPPKEGEGAAKPPAEGEPPAVVTEDKPPRGWSPAAREKWGTIPEDIRKEIVNRENASAVGVRQLQERYAPLENFARSLDPFIQEARSLGADAGQYIAQTMATERVLRTADIPTKFQAILQIADQYGVPLRDIINESVGQKILPAAGKPQGVGIPVEVQRELQESRQWRQTFEGQQVQREIAAFAEGKEFFEDVRPAMANFLETGVHQTLQDAYDAACWATPAVREVLLQRQSAEKQNAELQARQQTAAGASIKPNGSLNVDAGNDEDDDLADTVRKQWAASQGRV